MISRDHCLPPSLSLSPSPSVAFPPHHSSFLPLSSCHFLSLPLPPSPSPSLSLPLLPPCSPWSPHGSSSSLSSSSCSCLLLMSPPRRAAAPRACSATSSKCLLRMSPPHVSCSFIFMFHARSVCLSDKLFKLRDCCPLGPRTLLLVSEMVCIELPSAFGVVGQQKTVVFFRVANVHSRCGQAHLCSCNGPHHHRQSRPKRIQI